jgi:RNA methyltransferase, TrmH family
MLSKKLIKDIQSLGLKKHREESGLFVAEGPKIVNELAQLVPSQIETIYATKNWTDRGIPANITVEEVSDVELQKISQLKSPNEVLAVVKQFASKAPSTIEGICLYLDGIQDPGNFGTIIRIADWFGVKQIVAAAGTADLYNPKVVQSSMASIARVLVWYDEKGDFLAGQNAPVIAASLDGESVYDCKLVPPFILVIGNESKGISESVMANANQRVRIPSKGEAESLNAAVATGILLSHLTN